MILQGERGGALDADAGVRFVFAAGDDALQCGTAQFAFRHLAAIEPVLDVIAIHDDAALIELADGTQGLAGCGDERVDGGGETIRGVLRMRRVIEHLILEAQRAVARVAGIKRGGAFLAFGEEILHAAVAAGTDAPLELKLEVGEGGVGDEIAATAIRTTVAAGNDEAAVLNQPTLGGDRLLSVGMSAGGAASVKQQLPTRRLLLRCQRVGLGSHRPDGMKQKDSGHDCQTRGNECFPVHGLQF